MVNNGIIIRYKGDGFMRKTRVKNKKRFAIAVTVFVLIIAAIVCLIGFLVKRHQAQVKPLGDEDYQTTGGGIVPGGEQLSAEEVEALNRELKRSREVGEAQAKINSATYPIDTVEDFDLILVNKTHNLSKDYWPDDLVTIERHVKGVGNDDTHKLRKVAADALNEMLDAAAADGLDIRLRTGFRSYDYQASLYDSYVSRDGKKNADTYSARPGYSEHQTGLACDLGGKSQGYALSYDFGGTEEGQWVWEHAHEYGFIIRYTDGGTDDGTASGKKIPGQITGYVFEPWHIRYVGKDHAAIMCATYEVRDTLEEYLGIVDEPQYKN